MITLKFRGYGDDTFGEYATTGIDIDNCASCKPIKCLLRAESGAVMITGQYDRFHKGCWDISISQVDDDTPIPKWDIRMYSEDYSAVLEVDAPDDVSYVWFDDEEEVSGW